MGVFEDDFGTTAQPKKGMPGHGQRPIPALTLIAHPNLQRIGDRAFLIEAGDNGEEELSRVAPDFFPPGGALGHSLHDPYLSRTPLSVQGDSKGNLWIRRGRNKTEVIIGTEPLEAERLVSRASLENGVPITLADRIVLWLHLAIPDCHADRQACPDGIHAYGMVGANARMWDLYREIGRIGDLSTPVLLRGESGTGKEMVARAIHDCSRKQKPFLAVNLASIPPNLAASELFGAIKGSFTGADRNQLGFFRAAEGGTLFLDEIGETPPEIQVSLLRALETGEVMPLGSQRSFRFRARLIAATDADLEAMIERTSFRAPLFHRLAGYQITLPPLRQRLDDLGRLFLHFVREELAEIGQIHRLHPGDPYDEPWIPVELAVALLDCSWPGNLRQLRNVVRSLVIDSRESPQLIFSDKIRTMLKNDRDRDASSEGKAPSYERKKPNQIDADHLLEALRANQWNVKATARYLNIARGSLYKLMEAHPQIRAPEEIDAEEIEATLRQVRGVTARAADHLNLSAQALRRRMRQLNAEGWRFDHGEE
ncbi:Sigma-54-dependent Fis family transcriptional regulator [Sulfidibacter corallicola]|uniref:Sigma-54-dependent Fis family transcriptional regulator n=1 Tax=Sulfidibacter corallicola TaxID=2818388 RepID=A0A8A4TT26_SULCO|nr:sigma 54-interacting transcriptional regulator [Sulfidibacter corallicola]QTD52537.1 sigma-54-dependent Fis family transcriptional regulator [Sulfidibacter corallicola]